MKIRVLLGLLFCITLAHANNNVHFDFVDKSLNKFLERVVALDDQKDFKTYYQEFISSLKSLSPIKRKTELQKLRENARCSLEVKHPEWAKSLQPLAFYERNNDENFDGIRTFLTRYALYDEFCKNKASAHASMWFRFRSYSKHVTTKVTGWFNGLLPQKKVS